MYIPLCSVKDRTFSSSNTLSDSIGITTNPFVRKLESIFEISFATLIHAPHPVDQNSNSMGFPIKFFDAKELPFKVLEMLYNQSFGELNSHLVLLFVKKFSDYYIGTKVILDNNKTATIIKFNEFEVAKPLIRTEDGEFIDTSINRDIKIVELIYI